MPTVSRASPEPTVRGEGVLRALDAGFVRLDAAVQRVLPVELNPFAQTGAVAFASLIVAVVTGVVLVIWYKPSAVQAYASLEALRGFSAGQVMRSLHRYSSDACMAFSLLHALRLFVARRFGGARWLAWITGVLLVGLLWFVGWLGYWLVWDERARQVALGSARLVDGLPIFAEPFSLAFLMDRTVRPLLFFVVFFLHMLLPLAMGVALWLHLARLVKPRHWPRRTLLWWTLGSLLVLSLILPGTSAGPAHMTEVPRAFSLDAWYLLPLWLTDRLGGAALWTLLLVGGLVVLSLPWTLPRRRVVAATVTTSRCNDCKQCARDCPYDAITMVPRTDDRPFALQAQVDPSKCVGCGICVGSCDSAGTDVPALPLIDTRHRVDGWLDTARARGEAPAVLFACATSAAAAFEVDPETGASPALPGWRVLGVPCAGWVHPLVIERALRHGASGVLVIGCGPGEPVYRDGGRLTRLRLVGEREPRLRADKVPGGRLHFAQLPRTDGAGLRRACADFERALRTGPGGPINDLPPGRRRARQVGVAVALAAGLSVVIGAGSVAPYRARASDGQPELVVAFVHPGQVAQRCRTVSAEELARQPAHMRQAQVCERGRVPVRLRVTVDGEVVHERRYEPRGLFGDGASVAEARVAVAPGRHRVRVDIGDGAAAELWSQSFERALEFTPWKVAAVRFDRTDGFSVE